MTEKIRVLMIDNIAVESSRRSVYRELARGGDFDVKLLLPESWMEQGEAIKCEPEEARGVQVHTTPFLFGYRQHRVVYTRLFSLIREFRPHFLYIDSEPENYGAFEGFLFARLLSQATKLGLVSSRNLDYRVIGFPYKLAFTHRWCDSIIRAKRADAVFVRPRSAIPYMEHYAQRVYHLPHPVDCSLFRKYRSVDRGEGHRNFVIGYVGRIVESKGIRLIVQALAELPGNVSALMVGKGPLLGALQKLAVELNVSERIEFRPAVPYREVPDVLNRMDILVLPSIETEYWTEQFGRVLIEAMACEVPIIASRSGEIPDVLGEAGVLFQMGDLRDLIEKIRLLMGNDALRKEYATKGRAQARALYDAPVVAGKIQSAILQTLNMSGSI